MKRVTWVLSWVIVGIALSFLALPETSFAVSPSDCDAYAKRIEMDAGSVAGGAARTAARGAAFGGLVGRSEGAKKGAAIGAVVGGARRAAGRSATYRSAYDDCMAGRVKW